MSKETHFSIAIIAKYIVALNDAVFLESSLSRLSIIVSLKSICRLHRFKRHRYNRCLLQIIRGYILTIIVLGCNLQNEAMTGTHTQNPVYSRLTLALMEDTGWYKANYSMAQDLSWGKNLGCDFVLKSCKHWMDTKRMK